MKQYTVKKEIKLKSGETLTVGSKVDLKEITREGRGVKVYSPELNRELNLSMICFATKVLGKNIPTHRSFEKWSSDGIAKSIQGHNVEPDGFDSDGFPSWMIVVGLI